LERQARGLLGDPWVLASDLHRHPHAPRGASGEEKNMPKPAHERSELHGTMAENHERLEQLFERMLLGVRGKDAGGIQATWQQLDDDLRAHLRAEDELVLPTFELQAGVEAARIRAEHHQIRRELDELGRELAGREIDRRRAERFLQLLHEHLLREERVLYPWADSRLPRRMKSSVIARLRTNSPRTNMREHSEGALPE
jgi:hemerythrin-like domain-containing protein